jgi:hypothetical protein
MPEYLLLKQHRAALLPRADNPEVARSNPASRYAEPFLVVRPAAVHRDRAEDAEHRTFTYRRGEEICLRPAPATAGRIVPWDDERNKAVLWFNPLASADTEFAELR